MQQQSLPTKIILASTSKYRKLMLERIVPEFETRSPGTDETALPGESPSALVRRLALEKARSVANLCPDALVIGSDQVAECAGKVAGKPGGFDKARQQLETFSGQTVNFLSSFAIVKQDAGFVFERTVTTEVVFRHLQRSEIERYLELDQPCDCAGSFRSEANGPTLLERMRSDDPTAIMGLPLIELAAGLRRGGLLLP
jgi:septum formation protein